MPTSNLQNAIRQILPRKKTKAFGQLDVYPSKVHFATQNRGEQIFILVRKHIFTNFGWVLRSILIGMLPLIIYLLIELFRSSAPEMFVGIGRVEDLLPLNTWIIIGLIYYSTLLSYVLAKFLDWYFDIYLVTSERFIHTEFKILTGKFISEATLGNIQDVSQRILGLFPSIFDFGDVIVTTAAERGKFVFKSVPDPTWFRDVIMDLAQALDENKTSRRLEP